MLPLSTALSSTWSVAWCDWLCARSRVSRSSKLHIFQDASHLWGLPFYLLVHFPSLQHVQGSTSTGVFEGGCWPLKHSSLGFLFHFSLSLCLSHFLQWEAWSVLHFTCWPFLIMLSKVFWQECLIRMLESVQLPFPLLEFCQLAYLQYWVLCLTYQGLAPSQPASLYVFAGSVP